MAARTAESPLLYEHRDGGDHPEGGACLRVFRDEESIERLRRYSEEYCATLASLVLSADGKPTGWQFAAPAVFLAHHAAELALKVRWLISDPSMSPDCDAFKIHNLRRLVRKIEMAGGWLQLTPASRAQLDHEVSRLAEVTRDGVNIRYAEIDEKWCCVNLGALFDIVDFIRQCTLDTAVTSEE